jgi:hypothetical protein
MSTDLGEKNPPFIKPLSAERGETIYENIRKEKVLKNKW